MYTPPLGFNTLLISFKPLVKFSKFLGFVSFVWSLEFVRAFIVKKDSSLTRTF